MPRNVEIKARPKNFDQLRVLAIALGDGPGELIRQKDTFYHVAHGRLKLREFNDGTGELIAYERPDQQGPKTSHYAISPAPDPARLHLALAQALGVRGVVTKERTLIMCGRTRIHLDRVTGLGDFVELEVVLRDDENQSDGMSVARDLMARLAVDETDLVAEAYIDQLTDRRL